MCVCVCARARACLSLMRERERASHTHAYILSLSLSLLADGEETFRAVQRLGFPNRMIECMDLALLEGGGLLLACGGVDCRIHLYQCDRPAQEGEGEPLFAPIGELQGHDDWIRCLRFAEPDGVSLS